MPGHKNKMPQPVKIKDSGGGMVKDKKMMMDDMNKVMQMMHGGKVHDAKYYKDGGKVAGCGPARNNPMKTKKA